MCGIFGSTKLHGKTIINKKLSISNFRGPDNSSYEIISNKLILGHNRLSIFDLDSRSNQPFFYQNLAIVFNGEIYNFKILKEELKVKGHKFRTTSDTEVICALYIEYGEKCLNYLNGMFSFVIYDKNKDVLFGARDRLGQKPFFYYYEDDIFEFSSNLKQIEINNSLKLDSKACKDYFYFGYFLDPDTPYKNVYKLIPGSYFNYNFSNKSLEVNKYWSINDKEINPNLDYKEGKQELKELLLDSTKIRLEADVPVGIFLSGGVDSSLITSLAKEVKEDVNTYSIKFNEKKFDESNESKKIANYLGTNHHTFTCDLDNAKSLIEDFYDYYDEPFSDVSALPSLLLSKYVSKNVTVALTGDGADELFLGYSRYKWMNDVHRLYKLSYNFRKTISYILSLVPNYKIKMLAKGIGYKNELSLYLSLMTTFKTSYLKNEISKAKIDECSWYFSNYSVLESCSMYDVRAYLNSDINTKVDRASMAYSLETRSPFMDYRVVELSKTLPIEYKFKDGKLKYILKDILSDYLPLELFDRPKKGFGVPIKEWLFKDLRGLAFECLEHFKEIKLEFIDYEKYNNLYNEFYLGKANHSVEIWRMIMFVLWYKKSENNLNE